MDAYQSSCVEAPIYSFGGEDTFESSELPNIHEGRFFKTVRATPPETRSSNSLTFRSGVDSGVITSVAVSTTGAAVAVIMDTLTRRVGVLGVFVLFLGTHVPFKGTNFLGLSFVTLLFLHRDEAF